MFPVQIGTALSLLVASASAISVDVADVLYNGSVVAEKESVYGRLDGPKLANITANESSYDWWYFDAVSASSNASVTVVFYDSGPDGFINTYQSGPYAGQVSGSFDNGTSWNIYIDTYNGMKMTYGESDNSIQGTWSGADNLTFVGSNLTDYVITVDAPEVDIFGTMTFTSIAPAHYPCGLEQACVTEAMVPHVWWANAMPDALVSVDMQIGGSPVSFVDGVGYHDKNWGDVPFTDGVSTWYWGHAHVGPYSIVWFDAIDNDDIEYVSGYVAEDGEILASNCSSGALVVRPWGDNDEYPPVQTTGVMEGLEATFQLSDGSVFVANITTNLTPIDLGVYVRTLGTVEGGILGGTTYTGGRASFEEFKFAA